VLFAVEPHGNADDAAVSQIPVFNVVGFESRNDDSLAFPEHRRGVVESFSKFNFIQHGEGIVAWLVDECRVRTARLRNDRLILAAGELLKRRTKGPQAP
jgi:hypothetical protein